MMGDALVMALASDAARPDTAERLGQLFDAHYGRLYNLARRLTGSPDEARDAVQDTFLRAARSPHAIPWGMPHEEAWLVRVLINICKDAWRRQAVRGRVAAAPPPPLDRRGAESELVARSTIWRALEALPPRRRAILVMYEIEGTAPEAARKALADMKDFLPYKRYQLLDAAWIVCCAPNGDASRVSGRVRGPDARDPSCRSAPSVRESRSGLPPHLRWSRPRHARGARSSPCGISPPSSTTTRTAVSR